MSLAAWFLFYTEMNLFSLLSEGVSLGHSEADRQLLEAAKAGDVETVKVRYQQIFFVNLQFFLWHYSINLCCYSK